VPVDQQEVEGDVRHVAGDRDRERGAGVLQAAQDPGPGEHDEEGSDAEEGPAQVRRGVVGHRWVGAEQADQPSRRDQADRRRDHADEDRQPDPVDALGEGTADVSCPDPAGHRRGGAVGQEDAQANRGLHDRPGDAEAGELGRPEVTDDRGVGEQEEGLRDEGQEGRYGEPQDLPVGHSRSLLDG